MQLIQKVLVIGILLVVHLPLLAEGLDENLQNPGYLTEPNWFKHSFLDIRDDIDEAASNNKRVMLYFHQDGCPYCKKLMRDNFAQLAIAKLSQRYFDSISINMWGDREVTDLSGNEVSEKEFAKRYNIQFTPTILLLNEAGEVALRMNGYYAPAKFIAALNYGGQKLEKTNSFRDYLKANRASSSVQIRSYADTGSITPPYKLAKAINENSKPLLVLFEQKQCRVCEELHNDILQRKDSVALLNQFQTAVIDMWSKEPLERPDGKQSSGEQWAQSLKIAYSPTLVFFDTKGQEVFRTDAYLKAFHLQSALDYVASGAYKKQSQFQRYIEARAASLRSKGQEVELMN
jgi:thioredoxin-related protein